MATRYDTTGQAVTVTPPAGANYVTAYVIGAKGGGDNGGLGNATVASFTVTSPLTLYVGDTGVTGEWVHSENSPDMIKGQAAGGGGCSAVVDSNGKILVVAGGGGGGTSIIPGGIAPLPAVPIFDVPKAGLDINGQAGQPCRGSDGGRGMGVRGMGGPEMPVRAGAINGDPLRPDWVDGVFGIVGIFSGLGGDKGSEAKKVDFIGGFGGFGGGIGGAFGDGGNGYGDYKSKGGRGGYGGGGGAGGYGRDKKRDGWVGRGGGGGGGGIGIGSAGVGNMTGSGGGGGGSCYDISAITPTSTVSSLLQLPPGFEAPSVPTGNIYLKWSTIPTFYYSNRPETVVVPAGMNFVNSYVVGARGGGAAFGGKPAFVNATFRVTPGDVIKVYVGAKGGEGTPVLGCGGGGCSAITKLVNGVETILALAGGGGGRTTTFLPGGNALSAITVTNQNKAGHDRDGPKAQYPASLAVGGIGGAWGIYADNRSLVGCAGGYGGGGTAFFAGGGGGGGFGAIAGQAATTLSGVGSVVGYPGLGGSSIVDSSNIRTSTGIFMLSLNPTITYPGGVTVDNSGSLNGNGHVVLVWSAANQL